MNKNQRLELEQIKDRLEVMSDEERDKYENAPESLQDSERVCKFEANADTLQEIVELLDELLEGY